MALFIGKRREFNNKRLPADTRIIAEAGLEVKSYFNQKGYIE